MKIFAFFVLVLATLVPTHADTTVQTWQVTAECNIAAGPPCVDPANISAVFTTELEPGTFPDPFSPGGPPFNEAPVVMSIVGTFDGLPISFTPPPPGLSDYTGFGWMDGFPNNVGFAAGGNGYALNQFIDDTILSGPFAPPSLGFELLFWNAQIEVPEPPLFRLLLTALLLLGLMRWAQTSLRKLSKS